MTEEYEDRMIYKNALLGGSFLLLTSFASYMVLKNKNISDSNTDNKSNKDNIDNKDIQKKIKDAKEEGYFILIESIVDYLKTNENSSFDDFMKKKWETDYDIMIKSRNNSEIYSRNYSEWQDIYDNIDSKYSYLKELDKEQLKFIVKNNLKDLIVKVI
jgi:hypothetical protein